MNPQNQKPQITNSDLDFIRNVNDPSQEPSKKPLDKKIIVIIVLVIITIGVLVFGMVLGANRNVKKSSNSSNTANSNVDTTNAKNAAIAFMEKAGINDTNGAYELFSPNAGISREDFVGESMILFNKLNLSSCQPVASKSGVVDKNNRILLSFECKSKDNKYTVTIEFRLESTESGQLSIFDFVLTGVE